MGFFDKIKNIMKSNKQEDIIAYDHGLSKTRKHFFDKLNFLNTKYKQLTDEYFEELEDLLVMADIGVNTVMTFMDKLRERVKKENITDTSMLAEIIIDELFIIYVDEEVISSKINYNTDGPTVILVVGVNGVGKTTTIAKLANQMINEGKKVLLIAGDTFRAGAVEQIIEWGSRIGAHVVSGSEQADPSS
ncbi:MAG: signal recognition particle receptor subunit alpha, partial [Bacilli bacterium]|nr:signal recognition particle receptor subunit alpha [Bacilli bacterium]